MRRRWLACLGVVFLAASILVRAEEPADPEEATGDEVEAGTGESATSLNRDPKVFAEAIQTWFDNHTRQNAPPPPDPEAKSGKRRPRRQRVNPTNAVKQLVRDLAKTQAPAMVEALEREGILLYRLYELGLVNEERIADIDSRLPEMRRARARTIKGGPGQRTRHVPVPKMIERVRILEAQRRELIQLRTDFPPLWRSLVQRIAQQPAPIGVDDNLPRFAYVAILVDEVDLLKALFERGLTQNDTVRGVPLLTAAVNAESSRCFSFLLEQKPDLDSLDTHGFNALHRAILTDNIDMAKRLLEAGAKREQRTRCGRLPTALIGKDSEEMRDLFGIGK